MIKTIPKFNGGNFVEWTTSFNDILQMYWSFLSNITSGLEMLVPIPGDGVEKERKIRVILMIRAI